MRRLACLGFVLLGLLVMLAGCPSDDSGSVGLFVSKKPKASGSGLGGAVSAAASASASPTSTPNSGTTVTSDINTSPTPAAVATLVPYTPPLPTPTPVGVAGVPISVPNGPKAVAFLSNTLSPWILRSADLVALDSNQSPTTPYSAGLSQPTLIAADGYRDLWVVSAGSRRLDHLTAGFSGMSSVASFSTAANPVALAVDGTEAWVAHGAGTLIRITKSSGAVSTFAPVPGATAIALDSIDAWVTGANNLYQINRSTGALVATYPVGNTPIAVVVDANGAVWVANQGDGTLSHLPAGGSVATSISLSAVPSTLVATAAHVWVASAASRQATYLSLQGAVGATTPLPLAPVGSAVDAYGRVWFADPNSSTLIYVQGP